MPSMPVLMCISSPTMFADPGARKRTHELDDCCVQPVKNLIRNGYAAFIGRNFLSLLLQTRKKIAGRLDADKA